MENLSTEPIGVILELHQVEDTESLVSSNVRLCEFLSLVLLNLRERQLGRDHGVRKRCSLS